MSALSINVKGPSDLKLTIELPAEATVAELKGLIQAANADYPADRQRLIYSGRVLKDEEPCSKYGLKDGHTIHLVKGAPPAASSAPAAAAVPSNFAAGNQVMGNPLAPLLNAQNAGQLGGFNPFAEMGINTNDPNFAQNMMESPAVQAQVNQLLQNPAVIDQVIASNPELAAMGPQVRQMMQSEQFRNFLSNPEAMRQMMQMQQMMGGGNPFGGAAAGGGGAFPAPGGFGWGSGTAGGEGGAATGGTPGTGAAGSPPAAGQQGAFNPFAALGGGGAAPGQMPDFATMMQQAQQMQQMFGGAGGFGGFGGSPAATPGAPSVPPEERFASQLESLAGMGFHDAGRNVRALLASGGNVEAAVEYLFSGGN